MRPVFSRVILCARCAALAVSPSFKLRKQLRLPSHPACGRAATPIGAPPNSRCPRSAQQWRDTAVRINKHMIGAGLQCSTVTITEARNKRASQSAVTLLNIIYFSSCVIHSVYTTQYSAWTGVGARPTAEMPTRSANIVADFLRPLALLHTRMPTVRHIRQPTCAVHTSGCHWKSTNIAGLLEDLVEKVFVVVVL